jgi:sugar lactone lactonase YvrE
LVRVLVDVAVAGRVVTGAAPVWDITSATLLWAEVAGDAVHRFDPATGRDEPLGLPQPVAAAHPRRRGGLVLTLRDGVALVDPDGTRQWLVYWAREGVAGIASAVDRAGRLWVATAGDGALLRVEPDGAVTVVLKGADIAGIAFSADADTMYLADVAAEHVAAADFEPDTGALGSRRLLYPVPGGPTALCADTQGGLWVAPGARTALLRYRQDGQLDHEIALGAAHPTGCAFGGIQLTDLFVTAAPPPGHTEHAGPLLVVPDAGEGLPTPVFAG